MVGEICPPTRKRMRRTNRLFAYPCGVAAISAESAHVWIRVPNLKLMLSLTLMVARALASVAMRRRQSTARKNGTRRDLSIMTTPFFEFDSRVVKGMTPRFNMAATFRRGLGTVRAGRETRPALQRWTGRGVCHQSPSKFAQTEGGPEFADRTVDEFDRKSQHR